ncbi:MAG: PilZ domain-containing protein [Deltaproteobacteria bacterium]|nr:PilZ domain-containing protein [Deltaproteobacteria bacterium]
MTIDDNKAGKAQGRERRISQRLPLVRFVWYKVIHSKKPAEGLAGSEEGICKLCDISSTGVGILVPKPIADGSQVFLEISIGEYTISSIGEVVNTRPAPNQLYRVGALFVVLPPNDRVLLNRLLEDDDQD